jgi:hypothetical protein
MCVVCDCIVHSINTLFVQVISENVSKLDSLPIFKLSHQNWSSRYIAAIGLLNS